MSDPLIEAIIKARDADVERDRLRAEALVGGLHAQARPPTTNAGFIASLLQQTDAPVTANPLVRARAAQIARDQMRANTLLGQPNDLLAALTLQQADKQRAEKDVTFAAALLRDVEALKAKSQRVTEIVRADGPGRGRIVRIRGVGFDRNVQQAAPEIGDNPWAYHWIPRGLTERAYFHVVEPASLERGHFQTNPDGTELDNLENQTLLLAEALARRGPMPFDR